MFKPAPPQDAPDAPLTRSRRSKKRSGTPPSEDLHPELQMYLETNGASPRYIRHPLLVQPYLPELPQLTAHHNVSFEAKLRRRAEAEADRDWAAYVFVHERPYRLEALVEVAPWCTDTDYWPLVAEVWTDSENIREHEDQWRKLLSTDRPHRELLMSEEERSVLANLPSPIPIYRGFNQTGRQRGLSWTLDRGRAEWFAHRPNAWYAQRPRTPRLVRGETTKSLAYLNDRQEDEVIVFPEDVTVLEIATLSSPECGEGEG